MLILGAALMASLAVPGKSQALLPPVGVGITSDYGPRNLSAYNWHWGVDYGAGMWTPVNPVEAGSVLEIGYAPPPSGGWSSGWYIKVDSGVKIWAYLHLSTGVTNNNPISPNGVFEIKSVTLENPDNQAQTINRYAFVFWTNRGLRKASRVLVGHNENDDISEWHVRWGSGYILDAVSGSSITTTSAVSTGTIIAYSGSSGNVGAHLDLRVKGANSAYYDINPLYYVQHSMPSYAVTIPAPVAGSTLFRIPGKPEAEQSRERVQVKVVSSGGGATGKDLDRVKMYLFPADGSWTEPIFDNSRLAATVAYGGPPPDAAEDKNPYPSYITTTPGASNKTGVNPPGGMGVEDFYFTGFNTRLKPDGKTEALINSEAKFPDGDYALAALAHSIRYNNQDYLGGLTWTNVGIDNFRPYVQRVHIRDVTEPEDPVEVYDRGWALSEAQLSPVAYAPDKPVLPGHTYDIAALMSEYTSGASISLENGPGADVYFEGDDSALHISSYSATLQVPGVYTEDKLVPLVIGDGDYNSNQLLALAADKTAITPGLELTRNAEGLMQGTGGSDKFHYLRIDAASPIISYNKYSKSYSAYDYTCPGGIPERCGTEEAPINITFSSVPFLYTDLGSGVKSVTVYKDYLGGTKVFPMESDFVFAGGYSNEVTLPLKDGKYVQVVTDNLGRGTTMYFRIDPVSPRNEMSNITISPPYETYSVYGVAVDTGSGLGRLRLERGGEASREAVFASSTTEPVNYVFSGIHVNTTNYYKFTIQDVAGLETPLQLMQFVGFGEEGPISPWPSQAVLHRVSRIDISSGPCVATISSEPNQLEVPVGAVIADESPLVVSLGEHSDETISIPVTGRYLHGRLLVDVSPADSCRVDVIGASILSLWLGPKTVGYRLGDEPTQFDLELTPAWAKFRLENARWEPGLTPRINMVTASSPPPPAGMVGYPPEAPRAWQLETANISYDRIAIEAYGLPETMSDADKARVRMLKYKDGAVSDVTTGFQGTAILASTLDNCTFTLVAPMDVFDKSGPVVSFSMPTGAFEAAGELYVSTSTSLNLNSRDVSENSYALAGVATTYFLVDTEPTPACLGMVQSTAAPGGTCANLVYTGDFTLPEGRHSVYYVGADKIGNVGGSSISIVSVDGTAPEAGLAINGTPLAPGSTVEVMAGDLLTLSATDYASGGLASGLATTYFLVDITPEECEYSDWSGGVAGAGSAGSCENRFYTGPVALSEGEHAVHYIAEDNVGNSSEIKTVQIEVKPALLNPAAHPFYEVTSYFGSSGSGPGQFRASSMKFDRDGNLLVADQDNKRIHKFSPSGEFLSMFPVSGYGHSYFYAPLQVAPCPNGDIWVSDYGTKLLKFTSAGVFVKEWYIQDLPEFRYAYPKNIVCSAENEIYSLTWGNYIFKISSQGVKLAELPVSNSGSYLNGLARDSSGNLYTYHGATGKVRKYRWSGGLAAEWPSVSGLSADNYAALSVDSFDNVYLSRWGKPLEIYTSTGGYVGAVAAATNPDGGESLLQPMETAYNPRNGDLYLLSYSQIKILRADFAAPATPFIVSPAAGATVLVSSPLITGMGEISSLVRVYDNGLLIKELTANTSGYFSFNLPSVTFGDHSLTMQASDAGGNLSGMSAPYLLRTAAMVPPVFSAPVAGPSWTVQDTSATVVADFDGDGIQDVFGIGTSYGYNGIYVFYKGVGNGTFLARSSGTVPGYSDNIEVVAYDYDGDGGKDIVTAMTDRTLGGEYLVSMKGHGDGTFSAPLVGELLGLKPDMVVADMDKDGREDLVVSLAGGPKIYWGNSMGNFLVYSSTPIPAGTHVNGSYSSHVNGGLAVADFDADGNLDLVYRNAVVFGAGRVGFRETKVLSLPLLFRGELSDAQAVDLNGDDHKDIVLLAHYVNKALFYLNLGSGKFVATGEVSVPKAAFESVAADLNADGKMDMAFAPYGADRLIVAAGRGDGTLAGPYEYASGGTSAWEWSLGGLSSGDLDLDGKDDIVMASSVLYLPGKTVNSFMSYLNKASVPDWTSPAAAAISLSADAANNVTVRWTAPGDDGSLGKAASYDLRYGVSPITNEALFLNASLVAGLASPKPAGQLEEAVVSGLAGGVTYYFALKTVDEAGNTSGLSNSPGVFLKFLYVSTTIVNEQTGQPEVIFTVSTQATASLISGDFGPGAVVLATAALAGLTPASNLYEIGPKGDYDPPASLTFGYSQLVVDGKGLDEADIYIYEYFTDRGWVLLDNQLKDLDANTITVSVSKIASIFAVMGTVKDKAAPNTSLLAWCPGLSGACPAYGADPVVYAGIGSTVALVAFDPVVFGTATGVAFTEFKVGETGGFIRYTEPIVFEPGLNLLSYRSGDNAGNIETIKTSKIFVDVIAPEIRISSPAFGAVYNAGRDLLEILFQLADNSGLPLSYSAFIRQVEDKGTPRGERASVVAVSSCSIIVPMDIDDGLWRVEVMATDAVGNSTQAVSGLFEVVHDVIAPVTSLDVGEPKLSDSGIFINSATPLLLSTTDDLLLDGDRQGVGAALTYVSIDGGEVAQTAGQVHIATDGVHAISYYSVDKAGNVELAKTATFYVDNSAPEVSYAITGSVFQGDALYVSTDAVISLSAVEPPSSGAASGFAAVYIADSTDTFVVYPGTFTAAEGIHNYSYYAIDRLGNAGIPQTLAVRADGAPPMSEIIFSSPAMPGASGRLVISSDTSIGFSAEDMSPAGAASGVASIWYSVDGGTVVPYTDTFMLPVGLRDISYWAVDNLGHAEQPRTAFLQVGAALRDVSVSFEPSVINLRGEGKYVEARLALASATLAGFEEETIRITRINGVALRGPIFAIVELKQGKDKKGATQERKQSVAVKFDRQALLAVLPQDAVSVVTVEGSFDDDTAFIAEDSLRVINPGRIRKGHGGKWKHRSRACVDIGNKALKEDADMSVLTVAERFADRLERDKKASAKSLARRGEPFEFGPEGTVFEEPVEISLPYESYDPKKEKLQVAYWNPSSKDWEPLTSTLDTAEKVVKAKVGHFSLYQVVVSTIIEAKTVRPTGEQPGVGVQEAGPSTAFVLGEVYVYPNPAKGGAAPTFHIECGLADSVDIKVYTVSGREAHEATLTAMPAVIDQRYAYEYAWRGHIPSGVYLYFIEARKGGQKIKKTGKFAVVR